MRYCTDLDTATGVHVYHRVCETMKSNCEKQILIQERKKLCDFDCTLHHLLLDADRNRIQVPVQDHGRNGTAEGNAKVGMSFIFELHV